MPGTGAIERFAAMGTRVELHLFGDAPAGALAAARHAVETVDDALTIHRPSAATALNDVLLAAGIATIDDDVLFDALVAADEAHAATFGLFDVAADLGSGATWDLVRFDRDARTIGAARPLALDFGGLGKGIALDRASAVLRQASVAWALLTAGESSIAVIGDHPLGGGWPFSIPHPIADDETLASVELSDDATGRRALSISANVGLGTTAPERMALIDPARRVAVATPRCTIAVASSGAAAEAMSTALMVAGTAQAARLLLDHAGPCFRFDLDAVLAAQPLGMCA